MASKHIGLSFSSGQMRYALQRLWNPRTEKGLFATLRQGAAVKLVAQMLEETDVFFANVEEACAKIQTEARKRSFGGGEAAAFHAAGSGRNSASDGRSWSPTT